MNAEQQSDPGSLLRRYAPMIYGPTALYSVGQGAIIPLLPTMATNLGADLAGASLVAASTVVGQLFGNLPAGWLVARVGERWTMILASVLSLVGICGMLLAPVFGVLALSALFVGFCAAAFAVARHAFMTVRVPYAARARALALVGGSFRLGAFTGPFIAAALLALFGTEYAAVWFFAVAMVTSGALVTFGPDPETAIPAATPPASSASPGPANEQPTVSEAVDAPDAPPPPREPRTGVLRMAWRHRSVLSRLGVAAAALAGVRSARFALLPVWGVSIGLDGATVALVSGIAGAIDFSLFYASGQIMDRFGRLWASVPALLLMATGFGALAFLHDVDTALMWFVICSVVIAVGNGLSSGILLTLGSDLAPPGNAAAFLGSWRTLTDGGAAATPVVISALIALVSLQAAAGFVGVIALLGAAAFARWVPRYVPRQ